MGLGSFGGFSDFLDPLAQNFARAFPGLTLEQIQALAQSVGTGVSTAQAAQGLGIALPTPVDLTGQLATDRFALPQGADPNAPVDLGAPAQFPTPIQPLQPPTLPSPQAPPVPQQAPSFTNSQGTTIQPAGVNAPAGSVSPFTNSQGQTVQPNGINQPVGSAGGGAGIATAIAGLLGQGSPQPLIPTPIEGGFTPPPIQQAPLSPFTNSQGQTVQPNGINVPPGVESQGPNLASSIAQIFSDGGFGAQTPQPLGRPQASVGGFSAPTPQQLPFTSPGPTSLTTTPQLPTPNPQTTGIAQDRTLPGLEPGTPAGTPFTPDFQFNVDPDDPGSAAPFINALLSALGPGIASGQFSNFQQSPNDLGNALAGNQSSSPFENQLNQLLSSLLGGTGGTTSGELGQSSGILSALGGGNPFGSGIKDLMRQLISSPTQLQSPGIQSEVERQLLGQLQGGGISPDFVNAARERILGPANEALLGRLNQQGGGVADLSSPLFQELQRRQDADFSNDLLLFGGQNFQKRVYICVLGVVCMCGVCGSCVCVCGV